MLTFIFIQGGRILINDQVLPPKGAVNNYLDKLSQYASLLLIPVLVTSCR